MGEETRPSVHPAFYVVSWIFFSNITILSNKWILEDNRFPYPLTLTTLHLANATILTQVLVRQTPALYSKLTIDLTSRLYLRAIVPIGLLYTASLACSNLTYLYLSVPFIQMLKALAPVGTLLISWAWGMANPNMSVLYNILLITFGVVLSSLGEVRFNWLGFTFQMVGTVAECCRLLLIQILLKGNPDSGAAGMDPLIGLYYFAPICTVFNGIVALIFEAPHMRMEHIDRVGIWNLALNCFLAFMLNIASVSLIGKTSALAMNLTGILKSILLVVASLMIWNTPITLIQTVGYGIGLAGMFYYSLGPDASATHLENVKSWAAKNSSAGGATGLAASLVGKALGRSYERVQSDEAPIEIEQRVRTDDVEAGHGSAESATETKDEK